MPDERSAEHRWQSALDDCERWLEGLNRYVIRGEGELPESWQPPVLPGPMPQQFAARATAMAASVESLQISLSALLNNADRGTSAVTRELPGPFGPKPVYCDIRA